MSEETRGSILGAAGVLVNEIINSTEDLKDLDLAKPDELIFGCEELKKSISQGFKKHQASLLREYLLEKDDTQTREVASALSRAGGTREILKTAPILSAFTESKEKGLLQNALNSLKKAEEKFKTNDYKEAFQLAEDSRESLLSVLNSSYSRLAAVQERCVSRVSSMALARMDYKLTEASNNKGTVIFARKREKSVAMAILRDGKIWIDMAGFSGGACEVELQDLFRRLKKGGVYISRRESSPHFRLSGGRMFSKLNKDKGLLSLLDTAIKRESTSNVSGVKEAPLSEEIDPYYEQARMWLALNQK